MPPASILRAAACHVAPVFLSARATTEKCISLVHKAARNRANLVVFPESYISAFPIWSALRPPTDNHDLYKRMVKESVYVDGEEMKAIRSVAKQTNTMISIGISEKVRYSSATLFNSNVLVGSDGEVLVHHRKLMPTFFEKLTWCPGDGEGLRVANTAYGKIGNLICGENTNPLARYALMAQGEQIHISTWPAVWPTRVLGRASPINNNSEATQGPSSRSMGSKGTNYDNVTANRTRAAAHCFEAKCFGILNSGLLDADAIETIAEGSSDPALIRTALELSPRGATMFLDPTGAPLSSFTTDDSGMEKQEESLIDREDILYADIDIEDCVEGKQYHDVVGGYQRLDIFDLRVNRVRRGPALFEDISCSGSGERGNP